MKTNQARKNIIREALKEIEIILHGMQTNDDYNGFTPMEAQMIYNVLDDVYQMGKQPIKLRPK